ncbi:MAG: hydrogenase maturation protease [Anaerolineae bacterium]|nr:hydrogenase maturation protease [Anaerolineae bacterium]
MKTLVIGLGNPILTDDGVGIYTARALHTMLPPDARVEVVELSVGGLMLMETMVGYDHVILIDALWVPADRTGEVAVFDVGDMPETLNTRSTHDVDLPTALRIGRTLGAPLPVDHQIQIVAITAHDVLDFCEQPSARVLAAIPAACEVVLELLRVPVME